MPVNKRLWTPSYALVTLALCLVLLVAVRAALRLAGAGWSARRLAEAGGNPIALYVVFHALAYTVLEAVRPATVAVLQPTVGAAAAGVAYSLAVVAAAVAFAHALARRGICLRV